MIDWDLPIEVFGARNMRVTIDESYYRVVGSGKTPVKFPFNIWTANAQAGTWHINDDGFVTCAVSPSGYECEYRIRNKAL